MYSSCVDYVATLVADAPVWISATTRCISSAMEGLCRTVPFPVITYIVSVEAMPGIHSQMTRLANEGKIVGNRQASEAKQHVVIWTETEDIVHSVRSVMWRVDGSDVCRFCIRAGRAGQP
jgi:hypothetical protein